ncbi:hypothetical protein VNI00_009367 [Paramarasmius palmivorus]|uniref:Uncharacterized protein n=1 Tax=Paramarasmius palmivorus TaxID=297713 RepID=A0AAW0CR51_9AGAR
MPPHDERSILWQLVALLLMNNTLMLLSLSSTHFATTLQHTTNMYIPFVSHIERRKGGGGGGHGGGHGSASGKGSSGKGGSSGLGHTKSVTMHGNTKSSTSYGFGGGPASIISSGVFAGRSVGGGNRSTVFGSRTYGSGYPSASSPGVRGRGFPYWYWPLVFGAAAGATTALAIESAEYGLPDDTSRPGGPIKAVAFQSKAQGSSSPTMLRVMADSDTTDELVTIINQNCSSWVTAKTEDHELPAPEEIVQYYRASTTALALEGYNNTAVSDPQQRQSELPAGVDLGMLNCVNETIGAGIPLVDNGTHGVNRSPLLLVMLVGLLLSNML